MTRDLGDPILNSAFGIRIIFVGRVVGRNTYHDSRNIEYYGLQLGI